MKFLNFTLQFFLVTFLLTFLTSVPAYSNELPDGINDFVHSYLKAAKNNDTPGIRQLSHKAFLECSEMQEPGKYDRLVAQQIAAFSREDPIMKITYRAFSADDRKAIAKNMKKTKKEWPVNPEGMIVIMYSSFHNISKNNLIVTHDSQGWKWVHYCTEKNPEPPSGWLWNDELDTD